MNKRTFSILGAFLVIVAISPPVASAQAEKQADNCSGTPPELANFTPAQPPRPSPELPFYDADDQPMSIANFKGRGVVMNFWATWCVPCVREMPALSELKQRLAGDGIDVLTLSVDRAGAKVVRRFFDKLGIANLDILLDKKGYIMRKVGITGLPVTILIDSDGMERGRVRGIAEWDSPAVIDFLKRCIGPIPAQ